MAKVIIAVGFAAGLKGEAAPMPDGDGYSVTITYPEGTSDGVEDISGQTDHLWYDAEELEFLGDGE